MVVAVSEVRKATFAQPMTSSSTPPLRTINSDANADSNRLQSLSAPAQVLDAGFSPRPILLDFCLRWCLLGLFKSNGIAAWVFWVGQLLVIPLGILAWTYARQNRIRVQLNLDKGNVYACVKTSYGIFLFLSVNLGVGLYIFYGQLAGVWQWLRVVAVVLDAALFGFYLMLVYLASFAVPRAPKQTKGKAALAQPAVDEEPTSAIDPLDSRVLKAEARLASLNLSVETYSLESTLFGGLAFSAFLTLISSNVPVLMYTQQTLLQTALLFDRMMVIDLQGVLSLVNSFAPTEIFYALLCLECIFTSLFFMLVIASKVRYYALQKHAQLLVQQAMKYNQKKDDLEIHNRNIDPVTRLRLAALAAIVIKNIETVDETFKELAAVINFMHLFRGLGIGLFFALLVTGAFLLAPLLGMGVLAFILLTFAYTAFDKGVREKRLNELVRKISSR